MKIPAALAPVLVVALGAPALAQVAHEGEARGLVCPFATAAPVLVVPALDLDAYRAEDEARGHRPLRYGALIDVAADLSDGAWTELADGSRAWRLEFVSPGARSLALEFRHFDLPEGARCFVYDFAVAKVLGAYTAENRHLDGGFVFEPFPGERLTLEIDVPAGARDPVLELKALIHDYRDVSALMSGGSGTLQIGGPGGAGTGDECLIDVNCPQGDPFPLQKRAVVRTLDHGQLCSGALINNTAGDGTSYVLTADHCGTTSLCVYNFNYQTPGCGTGVAPLDQTVTGSTVLTTSVTWDSTLLRIDAPIPAAYVPFYAGWNRTTVNPTFALNMSHPSGVPKKIAIDPDGAFLQPLLGSTYWAVTWSEGYLQAGSSGSPLFDEAGRVRGAAVLVQVFKDPCLQNAWATRFDQFWTANGLATWLDPLATDAMAIDGFDPYPCLPVQNTCTSAPNSVGPGAVISWSGSQSVPANNFQLLASGCPPGVSGLFFYGGSIAQVPFGNGFRCVGNPLIRLPVINANGLGNASYAMNLVGTQIDAGETWHFQLWYRDPSAGGAFFNASDALSVPFCR